MACAHSELPLYMMHPIMAGILFWHAGHVLPEPKPKHMVDYLEHTLTVPTHAHVKTLEGMIA